MKTYIDSDKFLMITFSKLNKEGVAGYKKQKS